MTGEFDDPSISNDSVVVRRIALSEHIFDETIGRRHPSSQAFMQSGRDGLVSVYLLSETTYETVAQAGSQRYLATVTVGALRENGLGIIRSPGPGGPGHCDITGRKTRGRLNNIARSAERDYIRCLLAMV